MLCKMWRQILQELIWQTEGIFEVYGQSTGSGCKSISFASEPPQTGAQVVATNLEHFATSSKSQDGQIWDTETTNQSLTSQFPVRIGFYQHTRRTWLCLIHTYSDIKRPLLRFRFYGFASLLPCIWSCSARVPRTRCALQGRFVFRSHFGYQGCGKTAYIYTLAVAISGVWAAAWDLHSRLVGSCKVGFSLVQSCSLAVWMGCVQHIPAPI